MDENKDSKAYNFYWMWAGLSIFLVEGVCFWSYFWVDNFFFNLKKVLRFKEKLKNGF